MEETRDSLGWQCGEAALRGKIWQEQAGASTQQAWPLQETLQLATFHIPYYTTAAEYCLQGEVE